MMNDMLFMICMHQSNLLCILTTEYQLYEYVNLVVGDDLGSHVSDTPRLKRVSNAWSVRQSAGAFFLWVEKQEDL